MDGSFLSKENFDFLLGFADRRTSRRGYSYYAEGAVTQLQISGRIARAIVQGTEPYQVRVDYSGNEPTIYCSCPVGAREEFCKHVVALIFAWSERSPTADPPDHSLRDQLLRLSAAELVKIITTQCEADKTFEKLLKIRLSKHSAQGLVEVRSVKEFLKESFTSQDFVSYSESHKFAQKMEEGLSMLEELLEAGHASQCIELAEYAMQLADTTCQTMDDSAGYMGRVFRRIEELHSIACKRSSIDPLNLAERLFKLVTAVNFCQFWDCLETHKKSLGDHGRNHFRKLIEASWDDIPPRRPDSSVQQDASSGRSAITYFMQFFADESGDIDAQVGVLERDLQYAFNVSNICRLYREAGRLEDALRWSVKGFEMFPGRLDQNLVRETLQIYEKLNRIDDAVSLAWQNWQMDSSAANLKLLREMSRSNGSWPIWRERSYQLLRNKMRAERFERKNPHDTSNWWKSFNYGTSASLVAALMWEMNFEEAWNVAKEYGCSAEQLRTLAKHREDIAPLEVVPIYQHFILIDLSRRDPQTYEDIAMEVEQVGRLLTNAGQADAFKEYLGQLRVEYKRLRNFMKALNERIALQEMEGASSLNT